MLSPRQERLLSEIKNILDAYNEGIIDTILAHVEESQSDTVKRLVSERVDYYFASL